LRSRFMIIFTAERLQGTARMAATLT